MTTPPPDQERAEQATVMTEIKELVEKLRALQKWATPGPWEIHDSCSWRRIGTARHDGNVLCPTNSRTDNHPDLTAGRGEDLQANLGLIVGAVNALPQLLAAIELLSSQVEELKAALGPFSEKTGANDFRRRRRGLSQ